MSCIANILWFFFGGFALAIGWFVAGLLCMVTVVGIPLGLQCMKFARLSLAPFGRRIVYGGGSVSFLANILWIVFFGWELALGHLIVGALWCVSIVGIPLGLQCFKMSKLALMPFGANVL